MQNHEERKPEQQKEEPLASVMRPKHFSEFVGQTQIIKDSFLKLVAQDKWTAFLFWGPPGTGKTTLAHLIAKGAQRVFHEVSAVTSGTKEIKPILELSKHSVELGRKAHLIFIDEIHRLNKAQQDLLLPFLERGFVKFIGATTENPSFEVNNAILSRCLVLPFSRLSEEEIAHILENAFPNERKFELSALERIASASNGDARKALNLLELLLVTVEPSEPVLEITVSRLLDSQGLYYDKKSDEHYDTISAFIKSVRGSDPDAALYYLARMLEGGEDPLFIARRLLILASEDIGNASPMALVLAQAAHATVHSLGMPEARITLAQVTTYLACCEKSNRSYQGINLALEEVRKTGNLPIPLSVRNAPTTFMKAQGYGKDYKYAHAYENGYVDLQFLPDALKEKVFYVPTERGIEKNLSDYLKKTKRRKT